VFSPPYSSLAHFLLELVAYILGLRLFLRAQARSPNTVAAHPDGLAVVVGAVLGAAIGSKLLAWGQFPAFAFADFPDAVALLSGKTVVGGFLGGLVGVELAKWRAGIRESTGDLFVTPLLVATGFGRLGCLLASLEDYTYGNPTGLPWGLDFGDGVPRHPVALYEIGFLGLIAVGLRYLGPRLRRSGDRFRFFLASYLAFRFFAEFLKPPHGGFAPALPGQPIAYLYFETFTAIQLACVLGLAYYFRDLARFTRELAKELAWPAK
jgi:phosphatidylglycerol---prolipoprotein diacylglyceryl transferase